MRPSPRYIFRNCTANLQLIHANAFYFCASGKRTSRDFVSTIGTSFLFFRLFEWRTIFKRKRYRVPFASSFYESFSFHERRRRRGRKSSFVNFLTNLPSTGDSRLEKSFPFLVLKKAGRFDRFVHLPFVYIQFSPASRNQIYRLESCSPLIFSICFI